MDNRFLPGPQKYVNLLPCRLFLEGLGRYVVYFWDPARAHSAKTLSSGAWRKSCSKSWASSEKEQDGHVPHIAAGPLCS